MGRELTLRSALKPIDGDYDVILLDCPPTLGLLTVNALVAADHALLSAEAQYFALQGVEQALEVIELARDGLNPDLQWLGVVLKIADMRTVHSREAQAGLKEHFGDKLLSTADPPVDRLRRVGRARRLDPRPPSRPRRRLPRAGRRAARPPGARRRPQAAQAARRRLRERRLASMSHRRAVLGGAAAALLALAVAGCGADVEPSQDGTPAATTPTLSARPTPAAPAARPKPPAARASKLRPPLAFHVRRRTMLRTSPNGRMVARMQTKTGFKSPTILAVAARKPGWVLVRTSLEHHHVGWLPLSAGALFSQPRTIVIDLSRRTLTVFHRGKLTDRYKVAVGTDATPTPRGKFAVTDRLRTGDAGSDYGCCILALNAHQPKIAQGWGGGDRVAIHATPHTWTLGHAVSHGCVRSTNAALRQLMAHVRIGTPVTIHG